METGLELPARLGLAGSKARLIWGLDIFKGGPLYGTWTHRVSREQRPRHEQPLEDGVVWLRGVGQVHNLSDAVGVQIEISNQRLQLRHLRVLQP